MDFYGKQEEDSELVSSKHRCIVPSVIVTSQFEASYLRTHNTIKKRRHDLRRYELRSHDVTPRNSPIFRQRKWFFSPVLSGIFEPVDSLLPGLPLPSDQWPHPALPQ